MKMFACSRGERQCVDCTVVQDTSDMSVLLEITASQARTSRGPTKGDSTAGSAVGDGHAATTSSFATVHRIAAT